MAGSRTRGFLFADLRGYTDYLERRGDHAGADLLREYRAAVRGAISEAEGAEIRTEGDSFYVTFDSASAAVRCGLAIQERAAQAVPPIPVGIGIHAGETVETEEGLVGSAVNIAARVCAQARAGELLVTDTVRALTRTFLDVTFAAVGTRALKGIPEPIQLYRVTPRVAPGVPALPARRRLGRTGVLVAAAVVAVFAAGIAGATLFAVLGPSLGPSRSATIPSAPSPTAAALASAAIVTAAPNPPTASSVATPTVVPFPDANEAALLARLPAPVRTNATCVRARSTDRSFAATASIRCDLTTGMAATSVWFETLNPAAAALHEYNPQIADHGIQQGDCATQPKAWQEWGLRGFFSGHLVCYGERGESWVFWTYEAEGVIARAMRSDTNARALYNWWRSVAPFLRL